MTREDVSPSGICDEQRLVLPDFLGPGLRPFLQKDAAPAPAECTPDQRSFTLVSLPWKRHSGSSTVVQSQRKAAQAALLLTSLGSNSEGHPAQLQLQGRKKSSVLDIGQTRLTQNRAPHTLGLDVSKATLLRNQLNS